ncbi:Arylsulfatase [Planctomycetes bacterium CA13]|uniref:Arylsulfatase n=1 Tax=Novipirellula herctigrandis TaxID=2527986 RepID=A0A5C5YV19_9BACT|nr:Arylsulfatase [Planctomycetes bacterium CA13]
MLRHFFAMAAMLFVVVVYGQTKPNVIVYFADDISAREFPVYGSSVWSDLKGQATNDPELRARTPVMEQLAKEGVVVKTAWAATICNPSRAMMMTGRYAHIHKWWHNRDRGSYRDQNGRPLTWPLYESSPMLNGHIAQKAGYGTYWAGKTQMAGDLTRFGFDEGCFTPGNLSDTDNPFTDFKHIVKKKNGEKVLINADTGKTCKSYQQHGWYWFPHVRLMNDPSAPGAFSWWPNSDESKASFGINTYGPDVELDFVFDFMDRQQKTGKPFFVYHTTHLGHDAFDWFFPESPCKWPGAPMVSWDGKEYTRTQPQVTGDAGKYETHGTITDPGIHNHVSYIDYQIWLYLNKLKQMGLDQNTILIIAADNGTSGYGKGSPERQKGCHVPFMIYAPGIKFTKAGMQDVLLSIADVWPTLAEVMKVETPQGYEINGESFWSWLTTDQQQHRDWIYTHKSEKQLVRGKRVMKDGFGKWWDVSETPDDLISFRQITNWEAESTEFKDERDRLLQTIKPFDLHAIEHDAPGFNGEQNK